MFWATILSHWLNQHKLIESYCYKYAFIIIIIIIIIIIDRFYIALFSAREQTHCARMWFYMSE